MGSNEWCASILKSQPPLAEQQSTGEEGPTDMND